jgi:Flp pilus assembly pilin Flp
MIEYAAILAPVILGLVVYFARLEGRIAKMMTDLCWIKKAMKPTDQNHADSLRT